LTLWTQAAALGEPGQLDSPITFVFVGRLIDWKAVDLLLHAFKRACGSAPMRLLLIGDGTERQRLESLAAELGIRAATREQVNSVFFLGWLPQQVCAAELQHADCLVLPSLLECGGAVVLEAMSTGKAVIATNWGGPADYLDDSCGMLVPPTDREGLIQGLAQAMARLASSPEVRLQMGRNGRVKAIREYDWEVKVDRMAELYADVCRLSPR